MSSRLPTVWAADAHTIAKIAILRSYIEAWLPILATSSKRPILYVDGFAGPGRYTNYELGSPRAALDAISSSLANIGSRRQSTIFIYTLIMKIPTTLLTLLALSTWLIPTRSVAMDAALPVPYTQPADPTFFFGNPLRGPEPLSSHIELPLPPWDEALVQATVNQGNPFSDYGHFRLKLDVTFSPWIISVGDGPSQVSPTLLESMLAQFDSPAIVGDGSLMYYSLLRPPANAEMPADGWPLIIINPGVGSIGEKELPQSLGGATQWASPYHRRHYPAFVLRWHPQDRVTSALDRYRSIAEPAYHAAMEFLDRFIDDNPVDRNRIYVKGFSMGGRTTWYSLMDRVDFYAAAIPHSGSGGSFEPGDIAAASRLAKIPLWMMIGNQDPWTGSARFISTYQDLIAAGAQRIRFWEQQDVGHHDQTLRSLHIPEWFFQYSLADDFRAAAPTVLSHPQDQVVIEGQLMEIGVNVMGAPAPAVQWYKNGEPIAGAQRFFFRRAAARLEDAGAYAVQVTNANGQVFSTAAQITVLPDRKPPQLIRIAAAGPNGLRLDFDEPLQPGDGPNGSEFVPNYRLSKGSVTAATLSENGRAVILETEGLIDGDLLTLSIGPVMDRAASPNPVVPATFPFRFQPSLVGHWPIDETANLTLFDISGSGNHAEMDPRIALVHGGRPGLALRSNGNTNAVALPMHSMNPSAGTLALWSRRVGTGEHRRQSIVSKTPLTNASSRLTITIAQTSGFITFGLGDQTSISSGIALTETWQHLAITWADGNYTIYSNGETVTEGTYSELSHDGGPMLLGNQPIGNQRFAGDIDDLRLFNKALSADEIAELFVEVSTPPMPKISRTEVFPGGTLQLQIQTVPMVKYHLETTASLGLLADWQPLPDSGIIADSQQLLLHASPDQLNSGFVRVVATYPEN